MLLYLLVFLSNDPKTDHQKRGGITSNMHKHLAIQHITDLHDCNVFDMLLRIGGESQSRASENR